MEPPLAQMTMRGKWADGIEPRRFTWVVTDRLAISERPGGYGSQHRRVRRMEEIIWIRQAGFHRVVSLIEASHNLHNYEEQGMPYLHWPVQASDPVGLELVYNELRTLLDAGQKILVHHEELGDRLCGFIAGYLVWTGLVDASPRAITVVEQLTQRQLGPGGRAFVNTVAAAAS